MIQEGSGRVCLEIDESDDEWVERLRGDASD